MTTKKELLKVIRQHCLNCVSGSYLEVERCTSGHNASPYAICGLWAYRLGIDPNPAEISEARRSASIQNMAKLHEAKKEKDELL